jgi:hypothetical protein
LPWTIEIAALVTGCADCSPADLAWTTNEEIERLWRESRGGRDDHECIEVAVSAVALSRTDRAR